MSVPYAAFPKYGPEVIGRAQHEAEISAWVIYQASLKHERPEGEEENEPEPEGNLNTYTYIRKYVKAGQSRKRVFREQGIRAKDKTDATAQGRDAMVAELGPQTNGLETQWLWVNGSERVVKPRGKSFEQGDDSRRNESGGATGNGEGHDRDSTEGEGDGDSDDDTPKMPTCPECGEARGTTEGCCAGDPGEMPKPEPGPPEEMNLQLLRTDGQTPYMALDATLKLQRISHGETVATLQKSLADVDTWTRGVVKHDVQELATELYEAMAASHTSLKDRIATMQPKVGVSRTVLEQTIKKALNGNAPPFDVKKVSEALAVQTRDLIAVALNEHKPEAVDIDTLALLVADLINAPRRIEVSVNGKVKEITGIPHRCFDESLRAMQRGLDVFMVGPAGSGKGFLAQHLAEAMDQRFGFISCSEGMSEGMLLGRGVPLAETFLYLRSSFVDFYENGGVFMLDEIDAANPNVLLIINECLSSPHLSIPNRVDNPYAVRHEDFHAIVAANTWGTGPDMEYVGRNRLDASFLNRFVGSQIELDYDVRVEAKIADTYLEKDHAGEVLKRFWGVRKKLTDMNIRRVWSTRGLEKMCIALAAGDSMATVIDAHTTGWTPDEKSKAGVK